MTGADKMNTYNPVWQTARQRKPANKKSSVF